MTEEIYYKFLDNKHELLNSDKIINLVLNIDEHVDNIIITNSQPVIIYLIRFVVNMGPIDKYHGNDYQHMTFLIICNYQLLIILHIYEGSCRFYDKYYCDYNTANYFINRIKNEVFDAYGFYKYAKLCKIIDSLKLEECKDDLTFNEFLPRTIKSSCK